MEQQWRDFGYAFSDVECIAEVQKKITALDKMLSAYTGRNIAIGTHGTALSAIIKYYDLYFGFESFLATMELLP